MSKEFKISQEKIQAIANYLGEIPHKYASVLVNMLNESLIEIKQADDFKEVKLAEAVNEQAAG